MINKFKKVFKFGAQSFARNFWLALLTISILILLLLSINVLVVLNFLTDEASKQVESKVDVSIYLKPDTTDAEANSLRTYLVGLPSVKQVDYTKAEDVLKNFKDAHKDDKTILDSLSFLENNPFGGVMVVQTLSVNDYKAVLKQLESPVYQKIIQNKDFSDHEELVGTINKMTKFVKQFIIIISIFFAFIAMVIVFNTIKIAIYSHREEVGVMKLVGAANWFVRVPFIVEAIIYSLIATVISFILVFPLISLFQPQVVEFFNNQAGDIFAYYRENLFMLFVIEFLVVAGLSSVSAGLAIGRYLKK